MDQVNEDKNVGTTSLDRETEQSFTPGPWEVTASGFFEGVCIRTEDNTWVAQVWSAHGGIELPRDANARLIAAAPALYEALQKVRAMFFEDARSGANVVDGKLEFVDDNLHPWIPGARAPHAITLIDAALAAAQETK